MNDLVFPLSAAAMTHWPACGACPSRSSRSSKWRIRSAEMAADGAAPTTRVRMNLGRRTLKREDLRGKHLHWLAVLVQRGVSYLHDALVRFRARRQYLNDLAFHSQDIAGARGPGPGDLPAQTNDAGGERQSGGDHQAHGDRGRVPAARGQSPENSGLGGCVIQVKGLRIELRGEPFEAVLFYAIHP